MSKSKKGSAFERAVCKRLSMWFSHGKRDDIFWRTAGSGARATTRMKQNVMTANSAGDMGALDPIGEALTKHSIWEFKRGYTSKKGNSRSISLMPIVDKLVKEKDPLIVQWFEKLNQELKDHKRSTGFIILKRDRKNPCIALTLKTLNYLKVRNTKKYYNPPFGPMAVILVYKIEFAVMSLEDFLDWCEPETIGRIIKRRQRGAKHEQAGPDQIEKWRQPEYDPSAFKVVKNKTKGERILSVSRKRKVLAKSGRVISRRR